jgi:chemotaxis protein CheX
MKNDITEQDIKVFTEAVSDYFSALGDDPASIRTFYLACDEAREAVGELTGTIALSGDYRGAVHFAAPRAMLRYVLNLQKTTQVSDELLLDAVGEIANTLAGNARRRFGSSMNISVPSTRAGGLVPGSGKQTRERQFVVMIDWKHYTAILVVDIAHA